jgi:cytochrome c biogenesis protein CcmG/thiol:disulfide interchange protein DsbE
MKKKLAAILAIVLVMGLAATSCPNEAPAPEVGKLAPGFELNTLDGQSIALSQLSGTPVLVNFWATWCGPCAYEMPFLQQIYDEWPEETLVLLAVNIQESSSQVAQFMQSKGFSFTVLLDSQAAVAQRYNVQGIPTTFFIDREGIIQKIKVGSFRSKTEIETILSQLN